MICASLELLSIPPDSQKQMRQRNMTHRNSPFQLSTGTSGNFHNHLQNSPWNKAWGPSAAPQALNTPMQGPSPGDAGPNWAPGAAPHTMTTVWPVHFHLTPQQGTILPLYVHFFSLYNRARISSCPTKCQRHSEHQMSAAPFLIFPYI